MFDCHCSRKGKTQAANIPQLLTAHGGMENVEIVVTSPLTRAITTAVLGFAHRPEGIPLIVHPDCREVGGGTPIPENRPRTVRALKRDRYLCQLPAFEDLDFSLLPENWAKKGVEEPPVQTSKKGNHEGFLNWLRSLPQTRIVVVTHCNFITGLLGGIQHPENALPIECELDDRGIYLAGETPGSYIPTAIKGSGAEDRSNHVKPPKKNNNQKPNKKDKKKKK